VTRELDWIVPATVLVAIQQLTCLVLQASLNLRGAPPYINYGKVALSACLLALAVVVIRSLATSAHLTPLRRVRSYVRLRWSVLIAFVTGFALAWLQLVLLTWTKSLIPAFGPFWSDPLLANADKVLLGADAWRLVWFLRPLGGLVDSLYSLWSFVLQFVLIVVLLAGPSRLKSRALVSFFLTMALVGVVGQFALPSGGPIFWSRLGFGHRFDALPSEPHTIGAATWLWTKHAGDTVDFATGISAFPSMHVAMAAWMVLAVSALYPRGRLLPAAYFLVILLGSIYLGWHYLVDGIGGAFGAVACWYAAPRLFYAHRENELCRGVSA
jgi:membrane-associated phospholipid phosphatase